MNILEQFLESMNAFLSDKSSPGSGMKPIFDNTASRLSRGIISVSGSFEGPFCCCDNSIFLYGRPSIALKRREKPDLDFLLLSAGGKYSSLYRSSQRDRDLSLKIPTKNLLRKVKYLELVKEF